MSDESSIGWLDDPVTRRRGATWNPVTGCLQIPGVKGRPSGCDNCYAKLLLDTRHAAIHSNPRFGLPFEKVLMHPDRLGIPLSWQRPRRIFVNSLSDMFHVDVSDEFIRYVFAVMLLAQRHTFLLLTKRSERMRRFMRKESLESIAAALPKPPPWPNWSNFDAVTALTRQPPEAVRHLIGRKFPANPPQWPPANVQLGVSISTPDDHHRAIDLSQTPNAVPWISAEPLLDSLSSIPFEDYGVKWVVVGGESGPKARPMNPDWARELRDRCIASRIPFFFKQWGEWRPLHDRTPQDEGFGWPSMRYVDTPERVEIGQRCGTKRAGHVLDGREWLEYAKVPA
jgi:protein gp37